MEGQAPQQAPAPQTQSPEAPKQEDRLAPKVQALMRKEADAVRRMQEAKRLEAQLKTERESLTAEKARVAAFDATWKENPLKAVLERGLTPEQLWLMQQQGGQPTAEVQIKLLQDEIRQLREGFNSDKTKAQQEDEARAQQETAEQINEFKGEIAEHLDANSDKYPLTKLYQRVDLVYSVIDRHHEKTERETGTGEVMSIEEASKIVEARLLSEAKKAQEVLSKTTDANQSQNPANDRRRLAPSQEQTWVEKPVKTLAQMQQSVPPTIPRFKTDAEREANALALLRAAKQRRGLA